MIKKISLVLLLMPISLCSMDKKQTVDPGEEKVLPKRTPLKRTHKCFNLFALDEKTRLTGQPCLAVVELYKKFLEEEKNGTKEYAGINDSFLHSVTLSNLYRMFVEDMEAEKEAEEKANDEVEK